ncbi:PRC-barrel domain-containing protein [Halomonas sp. FeN2]|uniref:PRC-barrel domain-containing protein n=1 Tax=Vreelandella neptunia TaxID=115551 RepID=A0ABZ0YP65_9GAMM|nr:MULTISPECIES: PRC-barrel domain-containing protein [Halomonas]TDV98085.1 PRC-barrel domain protein [Halomonas alkaliantarctica]MBF59265.1 photosystem reaction center subunit H [Halomonas sp.]MDN3558972.1 PRC-barrel domain-containing protein [Halomonas neptunia]UBR49126.1 PRC-barrel domain-containing protein [Halomonas sp. FeN2]WQH13935.1 PRC-barrel domain-containing protein [Halomonas neptunia]|tara:strand:- start:2986 stop:3411 length:426 start_codon:yes stop_codon:yes gene_type:complete
MKMIKPAILGTLMVPAFMFAAGSVNAEENTTTMEATYLTETPENTFHADALTGNQVKSSVEDDEDIGTITDLVIGEDGQINAVVVGVGGFLGMGEKNVAIEWDSLELTKDEDGDDYVITVNASEDALEAAEEYNRDGDEDK